MKHRHALFVTIVLLFVIADQATKLWADRWLATPQTSDRYPAHPVELTVPPAADGLTLQQTLQSELTGLPPDQLQILMHHRLLLDGRPGPHDPAQQLRAGQQLTLLQREQVIVPGFWEHRFVRNPGSAWGLFRDLDPSVRRPMYMVIALLSITLITFIFHKSRPEQRLLAVALASILGGALGNFIDRFRLGFVIDFIDWFVVLDRDHLGFLFPVLAKIGTVGKEYHWPTFNIADVGITVGVGLLMIEVLRGKPPAAAPAAPPAQPVPPT